MIAHRRLLAAGLVSLSLAGLADMHSAGAAQRTHPQEDRASKHYLTTVYHRLQARLKPLIRGIALDKPAQAIILFRIDGRRGRVVAEKMLRKTGRRNLDALVLRALALASPFPGRPRGKPNGLKWVVKFK